jgi:CheY-like chemotaxis protein
MTSSIIEIEWKMELHPVDFHLPRFLDAIIGMFQPAQQEVTFAYEQITKLPVIVHADERRMRQVLINLLGNAIKFTDQGRITFRVGAIPPQSQAQTGLAVDSTEKSTCRLRFEVIDTGIGIPPDKLEHIFLPFEQVSDPQHRAEGTGLGLTITKSLVEAMNGRLTVKSETGQGSIFQLELEIPSIWMETKPYAPSVEGAVNGYAGPRRKVLVVDDNLHNRSLLHTLLEPLGFEVFEAENGLQALEQAQTVRPDVILIDLLMPIMSGFDAVHKLRQMPELNSGKKVVIIATSVHAFGKDIAHAISAGCDAFLIKPIDVQNLLALLKSHLGLEWMYHEPSASGRVVDENLPDLVPPPLKNSDLI